MNENEDANIWGFIFIGFTLFGIASFINWLFFN
jgi:hypothetical protein